MILIILPLLGAAAIAVAPRTLARWIAFAVTGLTFALSAIAATFFGHWDDGGYGLTGSIEWMSNFGITLSVGADSVALLLVLLTTLLMPLCVWGSFSAITHRLREYYAWLLALEAAMIGVFVARDLIFFYICFEFTLLPMFFLIAIYGGEDRTRASIKFFLYTFTGSLLTLAGLLYVAWQYSVTAGMWTFDIPTLTEFAATGLDRIVWHSEWFGFDMREHHAVLLALLAGFAVKVPLFPVHTWLPLAHTEAPTAGSVILAGVMLKLGTYGFYRFILPMTPAAVVDFAPALAILAIIGILYAALVCWVQTDVKKLIAYSSVSHLGFCILGLFALNPLGLQGSALYMLNHGLSTGALFLCVGMIYERYHTRDMDEMSGLARRMPVWAFFMVFFTLASVGLPGLNGFVSEMLCLLGAFVADADNPVYPGVLGPWYAAIAAIGMILAAMYLLIMLGKVVFGPLREPGEPGDHHDSPLPADLSLREIGVLAPLAVLCLWIGFQPKVLTDAMAGSVEETLAAYPEVMETEEFLFAEDEKRNLQLTLSDIPSASSLRSDAASPPENSDTEAASEVSSTKTRIGYQQTSDFPEPRTPNPEFRTHAR